MVSRESKIETMKDIHLIGGVFYDDILESEDEESSSTLEEVDSVFSEEAINVRVELCTEVLKALGEDVSREGIVKTPLRYAKALNQSLIGYTKSAQSVLGDAIFKEKILENDRQIVLVQDIEFFSTLGTTLLPFFGQCHIGYVPSKGRVAGLSKFARIVDMFSKRLQNPQSLVDDIATSIDALLQPDGIMVVISYNILTDGMSNASKVAVSLRGVLSSADQGNSKEEIWASISANLNRKSYWTCEDCYNSPLDNILGDRRISYADRNLHTIKKAVCGMYQMDNLKTDNQTWDDNICKSATEYSNWLLKATAGSFFPLDHIMEASRRNGTNHSSKIVFGNDVLVQGDMCMHKTMELLTPIGSTCEHHILPFFGMMMISIVGGSGIQVENIQAVIWKYSRQLQLQERLVHQVISSIQEAFHVDSVMVVMSAYHHCMRSRGAHKTSAKTVSVVKRGLYKKDHTLSSSVLKRYHTITNKEL